MRLHDFDPPALRRQFSRIALTLSLCSAAALSSLGSAAENDDATLSVIMADIIMPAADVLWQSVYPDVGPDNEEILVGPATDEDWQGLRKAAASLDASADLLLNPDLQVRDPALEVETPPGELSPEQIAELMRTQQPAWAAHTAVLRATAQQALAIVDARDTEALYDLTGGLDASCTSCHQQFWYPEQ
ncbi:MAG TPA: hypothetical protein VNR18_01485 [Hyphomicrobiales bacterium]|nr:hypothetical protein [Hyphomicrobiales bacterium]